MTLKHLNKKRNKMRRRTVSQRAKESKFTVSIFSAVLICAAGLLYVFQISGVATKGYEIGNYERELFNLQKENQKMSIEIADLKSMDNLKNESGELNAIDHKDIAYITSISSAVAME
jgi:Tfp pilus assembly protein PilN